MVRRGLSVATHALLIAAVMLPSRRGAPDPARDSSATIVARIHDAAIRHRLRTLARCSPGNDEDQVNAATVPPTGDAAPPAGAADPASAWPPGEDRAGDEREALLLSLRAQEGPFNRWIKERYKEVIRPFADTVLRGGLDNNLS